MHDLEAMRASKGMTQEAVAMAAKISRPAYCNIENGVRRPSPEVAQRIARVLGFEWTRFFETPEETENLVEKSKAESA